MNENAEKNELCGSVMVMARTPRSGFAVAYVSSRSQRCMRHSAQLGTAPSWRAGLGWCPSSRGPTRVGRQGGEAVGGQAGSAGPAGSRTSSARHGCGPSQPQARLVRGRT